LIAKIFFAVESGNVFLVPDLSTPNSGFKSPVFDLEFPGTHKRADLFSHTANVRFRGSAGTRTTRKEAGVSFIKRGVAFGCALRIFLVLPCRGAWIHYGH